MQWLYRLNQLLYKPVERMATVGLSTTKTSVTPIAARSPISGGPMSVPDSKTFSPAAISHPSGRISCPTTGSFKILISNSVHPSSASFVSSVSSTYQRENHERLLNFEVYAFKIDAKLKGYITYMPTFSRSHNKIQVIYSKRTENHDNPVKNGDSRLGYFLGITLLVR